MKFSVAITVLVVLGVIAGGGYYFIHQREIQVAAPAIQAPAAREQKDERVRKDIGTYKDAKHPSFPGSEKKQ